MGCMVWMFWHFVPKPLLEEWQSTIMSADESSPLHIRANDLMILVGTNKSLATASKNDKMENRNKFLKNRSLSNSLRGEFLA